MKLSALIEFEDRLAVAVRRAIGEVERTGVSGSRKAQVEASKALKNLVKTASELNILVADAKHAQEVRKK